MVLNLLMPDSGTGRCNIILIADAIMLLSGVGRRHKINSSTYFKKCSILGVPKNLSLDVAEIY